MGKVDSKYYLHCISHTLLGITLFEKPKHSTEEHKHKLKSENYTPDDDAKRSSRGETHRFRRRKAAPNNLNSIFLLAMISRTKFFTATVLFSVN